MSQILADPAPHLEDNADRWEGYLDGILNADLSDTFAAGKNAELDYKRAAAKAIYNGEITACLEDQSANGYHIDASETNSKQSVNMVRSGDQLALRGWFELNQEGAREHFTDVIGGSFTIEATVDLDRGIGEYDDGHAADYHNGHTFHSFRVYGAALTPEVLDMIIPKDERVELWYDFDKLTYLPAT